MDFETILGKIGEFGKFQRLLCVYLTFTAVVMSFPYISQMIVSVSSDHWCRTPELEDLHLTTFQQKQLMIPRKKQESYNEHSKCEVYDVNSTELIARLFANDSKDISDFYFGGRDSRTKKCQHGWVFDKKQNHFNSLIMEKEWVCDQEWKEALLQMSFWAGTAMGPIIFGPLIDVIGRQPVIIILYSTAAIAGILTALTPIVSNKLYVFAVRCLAGIPYNVMCSTPYILVIEYVQPKKRGIVTLAFTLMVSVSWIVLPLIAHFLGDWKLFVAVISPLLLGVTAATLFLPESLTWLMVKKKSDRAINTIKRIAKVNDKFISDDFLQKFKESVDTESSPKTSFSDMFKTRAIRKLLFLTSITWTLLGCGYTGAIYSTVALNDDPFISMILGGVLELAAPFLQYILSDRIGRRWTCFLFSIVCSICFAMSSLFADGEFWTFVILTILARVAATITFNTTCQHSIELFPAVIRARCIAFRQVIGSSGPVLSSYIVFLKVHSKQIPLIILSFLMFILSFFYLMLPETMNKKLCNDIREVNEVVNHHKICSAPCFKFVREGYEVGEKENRV